MTGKTVQKRKRGMSKKGRANIAKAMRLRWRIAKRKGVNRL